MSVSYEPFEIELYSLRISICSHREALFATVVTKSGHDNQPIS